MEWDRLLEGYWRVLWMGSRVRGTESASDCTKLGQGKCFTLMLRMVRKHFLIYIKQTEVDVECWMALFCQDVFDNGWMYSKDINGHPHCPNLSCTHSMRERIFHTDVQITQQSYEFWSKSKARFQYSMTPHPYVVEDMKTGLSKFQKFRSIGIACQSIPFRGQACRHRVGTAVRLDATQLDVSNENGNDNNDLDGDIALLGHNSDDDAGGRSLLNQKPHLPRRRILPEIPLHETEPSTTEEGSIDSDGDPFDDYESALRVFPDYDEDRSRNMWTFHHDGLLVDRNWNIWRDRGYRLERDFYKMFDSQEPVNINDYLLPYFKPIDSNMPPSPASSIPSLPAHSSAPQPPSSASSLSEGSNLPPLIETKDVNRMGAREMLDEAGLPDGKPDSQAVFVKGKSRSQDFIELDLEKDETILNDHQVEISIDIDSVIWVTYKPQFSGSVYLHLLPLLGDKPPFSINNHVYINILQPPTKLDREEMQRSHTSKRYPLSAVPHTHFGEMGRESGQFDTYIFFPRMIRKNPDTGRMSTLIPKPVQELWFSEVVIPALNRILVNYPGISEYLPTDMDSLRRKIGDSRQVKTLAVTPISFSTLITTLRGIINDQPDLLGRFSSFFFVVDARGIKLLCKQRDRSINPYQWLRSLIPDISWDYMSDRSHGELYLDLGISYHPSPRDIPRDIPLVGLWRLDRIHDSYDLMGMQKGTIHHTAMLRDYGGRQAETKVNRSRLVHLNFRSSYNLCFEVVRRPGIGSYLCNDQDAIKMNDNFTKGCRDWKGLFASSQFLSFGVREELRGSGLAILKLLDIAHDKVSTRNQTDKGSSLKSIRLSGTTLSVF